MGGNEAFSRVRIDAQLRDPGWTVTAEARAEVLGIRFEAFLASMDLTAEQQRFARLIGERIKADAAELTNFEAWRFVRPPFSNQGGIAHA
jgi:hypothetical protein